MEHHHCMREWLPIILLVATTSIANAASFSDGSAQIADFVNAPEVQEAGQYKDLDFADLDGDGLLDVVLTKSRGLNPDAALVNDCSAGSPPCAGSAGDFTVELADPTTAATLPQDLFTSTSYVSYDSDTVDLDRDGRVDFLRVDSNPFIFGGSNRPRVRTWMNRACAVGPGCPHGFQLVDETDTTIGTSESAELAGPWDDADAADINEDGFVDIGLAYRVGGGQQAFMINLGPAQPGHFVTVTAADTESATSHDIEFADLDDDGWMDFVMAEWSPTTNYVYFHTRELVPQVVDGQTVQVPVYEKVLLGGNDYVSWTVQAVDLDGDDDLDVFIGNRQDTDQIFRNDGSGNLTEVTASVFDAGALLLPMSNISTYDADFGDLDNDGDIDIVTTQADGPWTDSQNTLWTYDAASGQFDGATQPEFNPIPALLDPSTWGGAVAVTFGDLDNDGALDVFFGADYRTGMREIPRLYLNDDTSSDTIDPKIRSVTTWLNPPDGSAFAVKARITDRLVRVDEISAEVQFTLSAGAPPPPSPMHYVGANSYRAHIDCTALGTNTLTGFTINASDASGNSVSDGPYPVSFGIAAPTTASPAAIGAGPWAKLLNVQLNLAPLVANLEQSLGAFTVTIGGSPATLVNAYALPGPAGDEVWLTVELPSGLTSGLHDLALSFDLCGTLQTTAQAQAIELSNYDWALAIDRSGSMGFEADKMPAAKQAAKLFLDLNESGDKVGAAWFAETLASGLGRAEELFPMTLESALPDPTDPSPSSPYNLIDGLSPGGSTSIGAGLDRARTIFEAQPDIDEGTPVYVVISDGRENTEPFWDSSSTYYSPGDPTVNGDFIGAARVYTIALGEDADQELLQRIATETGGQYFYLTLAELQDLAADSMLDYLVAPVHAQALQADTPLSLRLSEVYKRIQEDGGDEQRILSTLVNVAARLPTAGHDDVSPGLTLADLRGQRFPLSQLASFEVEPGSGGLTLAVQWPNPAAPANAVLLRPDGTVVNAGPQVRIRREDTHITYKIGDPQPGTWYLALGALKQPLQAAVMASLRSLLSVQLITPDGLAPLDAAVPIRLLVQGTKRGHAQFEQDAWVIDPDGNRHAIEFVDDGSQADGRRRDDLYGALFQATGDGGSFRVEVELAGEAPGIGRFTRGLADSFLVAERDSDGDGMPDRWEIQNHTNPKIYDAHRDPDRDALNNFHERHWGTDPLTADSDGGGTDDGTEARNRLEPLDPADDGQAERDDNGNGIPDRWEGFFGLPTDADHSDEDPDGDGLSNAEEYEHNTRPDQPDSDGDGLSDGAEVEQGSDPRNANDTSPRDDGFKLPWWVWLLVLLLLLWIVIWGVRRN